MIHLYCGDGKGKTTAALGLALRAYGAGFAVVVAQFLKTMPSGELTALAALPGVQVIRGTRDFGFTWTLSEADRAALRAEQDAILQRALAACPASGETLLVLDEAVGAYTYGYLDHAPLLAYLEAVPKHVEVVLTGRDPAPELLARADYVTEMKKVRHPFDRGVSRNEVRARAGLYRMEADSGTRRCRYVSLAVPTGK